MGQSYKHITVAERTKLEGFTSSETHPNEIAKLLGRHRSTIYRERNRNFHRGKYHAETAHSLYLSRRKQQSKLGSDADLLAEVTRLIKLHYSPEQISIELKEKNIGIISHETIYQFIYSSHGKQLGLSRWLPRRRKVRKSKKRSQTKHSTIPNRNPIKNRPKRINERKEPGHWEGDLMIFSNTNTNLITLRERYSRVMLAIKNSSKHADVTANNIIKGFNAGMKSLIDTLTFDNGGEFAMHELIARKLELETYFCEPYSSWQKGSVEQGNGVIRIELPRATPIDTLSQNSINKMMKIINNRPMRLHGNLSPASIFKKQAGDILKGFVALQV